MIIRKATLEDLNKITAIYNAIHDQEEQGITTIGWVRTIYPTVETAKLSILKGEMFVAIDQGIIVAAARINQEQVAEYVNASWQYEAADSEVMVLHTLVVLPVLKGHGYGKEFVTFYERYALEHQCHYLRMDTNARNNVARDLYKKLGYREAGIVSSFFNGIADVQLVCLEKKI